MTQTPYQTGYKDRRIYCQQGPERLLPERTGLLSGLNFVFKDLFDVAGFTTGAGNPTWLKTHPPATHTSPLITQLLQAGATCLGRVQTDELAYSLNGQNCHYGTPVNPLAPDCLPGGSSSGSAVAVAQGDVDFSIGTDTGGSVRIPASYCGLYGLRPTVDRLDLTHCFELAKSFDTAGIFAREIGVLQQVYPVLTTVTDTQNKMSVKHFYYDRSLMQTMSDARMAAVRQLCQQADITLIERDFFTETTWDLTTLSSLFRTIQGYEIIQQHRAWLDEYGQTLDSAIFERVEWARTVTSKAYQQSLAEQTKFCEAVHAYLDDEPSPVQGIWLLPTTPAGPPRLDLSAADFAQYRIDLMGLTAIAGLTGRPQLHIPIAGLAEGPCGFSLLGGAGLESVLIDLAQQLVNQETLS